MKRKANVSATPGPLPGSLSDEEKTLLGGVDQALRDATQLYQWWLQGEAANRIRHIPVVRQRGEIDSSYSFIDQVALDRGVLPVLGLIQDMFYDRPKAPPSLAPRAAEWYRAQIQEFVLRYLLRVAWFGKPRPTSQGVGGSAASGSDGTPVAGWRISQLFYKLKDTGEIRRFGAADRNHIVDLRQIGHRYEWILVHIRILDFTLGLDLLGSQGPRLEVPVREEVYAVINRDFVINRDHPEPGVLGEYGFATPVIPVSHPDSILGYGPNGLVSAFQRYTFRVLENGEVRMKLVFIANQPTRMIKVEPVTWSFQLADLLSFGQASRVLAPLKEALTQVPLPQLAPLFSFIGLANSASGGMAERQFCISRRRLYLDIMTLHFMAIRQFILQTLLTWSLVADWRDEAKLPAWVTECEPLGG